MSTHSRRLAPRLSRLAYPLLAAALAAALSAYQPFHAARAELLFRAGKFADSVAAYDQAIAMAPTAADAAFLIKRRARMRV